MMSMKGVKANDKHNLFVLEFKIDDLYSTKEKDLLMADVFLHD